jgi:hypothetical protein
MNTNTPAAELATPDPRRRRGGRPRAEPGLELSERVSCAVTPGERDRIRAAAAARGLKVSELVRARLLGEAVPEAVAPREARDAWLRLAPLQSNLNQIAAHLNSASLAGAMPPASDLAALPALVAQLHDEVVQLRLELLGAH